MEAESQYTICINIVFKNITARGAILRDQCLEIRTQPSKYNSDGFSMTFMALVIGAVVLVLLIIMVLALSIQRRCLKPIRQPLRQMQRAISRRSMAMAQQVQRHKHNANHHNHIAASARISSRGRGGGGAASRGIMSNEDEASCAKVHRIPQDNPRNPFLNQLHTNNGNNSDFKDWALPVSVNYSRLPVPPEMQPPKYSRSSSCSSAHIDLIDMRPSSPKAKTAELNTFGHQRKDQQHLRSSRSNPGHAAVRALPPTISKQVMRSKNAREKDASKEFDIKGTYMYFAPSGSLV